MYYFENVYLDGKLEYEGDYYMIKNTMEKDMMKMEI